MSQEPCISLRSRPLWAQGSFHETVFEQFLVELHVPGTMHFIEVPATLGPRQLSRDSVWTVFGSKWHLYWGWVKAHTRKSNFEWLVHWPPPHPLARGGAEGCFGRFAHCRAWHEMVTKSMMRLSWHKAICNYPTRGLLEAVAVNPGRGAALARQAYFVCSHPRAGPGESLGEKQKEKGYGCILVG